MGGSSSAMQSLGGQQMPSFSVQQPTGTGVGVAGISSFGANQPWTQFQAPAKIGGASPDGMPSSAAVMPSTGNPAAQGQGPSSPQNYMPPQQPTGPQNYMPPTQPTGPTTVGDANPAAPTGPQNYVPPQQGQGPISGPPSAPQNIPMGDAPPPVAPQNYMPPTQPTAPQNYLPPTMPSMGNPAPQNYVPPQPMGDAPPPQKPQNFLPPQQQGASDGTLGSATVQPNGVAAVNQSQLTPPWQSGPFGQVWGQLPQQAQQMLQPAFHAMQGIPQLSSLFNQQPTPQPNPGALTSPWFKSPWA